MFDAFFILVILLVIVAGPIIYVVRMALMVKTAVNLFQAQQQAMHRDVVELERLASLATGNVQWEGLLQGAHEMEAVLSAQARRNGAAPNDAISSQFAAAWWKAQNQLGQLDKLNRERADLRLADMKSQAASMGLFL